MKPLSHTGVRNILAAATGALLLGTAVYAFADPSDEPLATLYVGNDEVWWDPKPELATNDAVLAVSDPNGDVTKETFSAGSPPYYAVDEDGVYTYELYGIPQRRLVAKSARSDGSPGAIDANGRPLSAATTRGPSLSQVDATVQSGSFSVIGGVPVDPSQQED